MKTFAEHVEAARDLLEMANENNVTPKELITSLEKESRYTIGDWSMLSMAKALRYILENEGYVKDQDEVAL